MLQSGRRTKGKDRPSFVHSSEAGGNTAEGWSMCVWGPAGSTPTAAEAEGFVALALGFGAGKASKPKVSKAEKALAAKRAALRAELEALDG